MFLKLAAFNTFSCRIPWIPDGYVVSGGSIAETATGTSPAEHAVRRGCIDSEHRGRLEGVRCATKQEPQQLLLRRFFLEKSATVRLLTNTPRTQLAFTVSPVRSRCQAYCSATTEESPVWHPAA